MRFASVRSKSLNDIHVEQLTLSKREIRRREIQRLESIVAPDQLGLSWLTSRAKESSSPTDASSDLGEAGEVLVASDGLSQSVGCV